jgi:hypothetical protein
MRRCKKSSVNEHADGTARQLLALDQETTLQLTRNGGK